MSSLESLWTSSAKLLSKGRVKRTSCLSSVNSFSSGRISAEVDKRVPVVKANASANEDAKLRDDEIVPQMRWVFSSYISK